MKKPITFVCAGLALMAGSATAQWNNWGMPGGSSMPGQNMMPWGGQRYAQPQYAPQPSAPSFMPWGGMQQAPVYQAPPAQPFGGMMPWGANRTPPPPPPQPSFGGMMPWGGMAQPQSRPQPQPQGFMMPGMDQGIRSMMQPGKIMAEEATPGVYMKPTWQ